MDQNQINPIAITAAKAIRQQESGGDYSLTGKSGEYGGYQFTEPTWNNYSRAYGINVPLKQATREQQNEVAARKINDWISSGRAKNIGEIASMWNAGEGKPQAYLDNNVGTNQYGVHYDTPAYAKAVAENYQKLKGNPESTSQPQTIDQQKQTLESQGKPVSINPEKVKPTIGGNILRSFINGTHIPQVATNLVQAGETAVGHKLTEPLSGGYLGRVQPLGADPNATVEQGVSTASTGRLIKSGIAAGLETGSYLIGGPAGGALKEATLAGKVAEGALQAGKSGIAAGALAGAGSGLGENKDLKGTLISTGVGALSGGLLGGAVGGIGPIFGKGINAVLGKNEEVLRNDAIENTTKALGIFGKKNGTMAMSEPTKMAEGLSVIRKYATDFDPKNSENIFDDTLKAWTEARDTVFNKYDSIARQAGDNGTRVDTTPLKSFLENYTNGISTAPKTARAQRILGELQKNFPKNSASPLELQKYVQLLNEELGGLTGGAEKGATGVTADFVKLAREKLDDAITKSTGKEYQGVRNEYSSLKSVEDGLVRQYQKILRKKGSGLADYADMISNGDVLSGVVSGNPALMVKGVATRLGSKFIKSLNDPANYLKDAFGAIDKIHERIALKAKNVPRTAIDSIKPKNPSLVLPIKKPQLPT